MSDTQSTTDTDEERTTIRTGREFEEEYRLSSSEAGQFLVNLGEQLRDDDELTLVEDEWELPFAFGEPVELEVDFDGVGEPELEIELELPGRTDETAPDIE
jgi:amphi-Trp domain-containing protein